METFEIIKILHIIAVISWMAGLLYLPRIFVYHSKVQFGSETCLVFQEMELKLLRYIMNPAMIASIIFGLYLAKEIGFENVWIHIKTTLVIILAIFHMMLSKFRRAFANNKNCHSEKFFRIINEVPTITMILIVAVVIIKPFQ